MDNRMDDRIEEIRKKIGVCDDIIIKQLVDRMECIQEIIAYKKQNGIPILQPEQEKKQEDNLKQKLGDNVFEEEILNIFKYIVKNSRKIQAKALFNYNILLDKQGMSISEIFAEYGEVYFRNLECNTLIELQKSKQTIVSCGGGVVVREDNKDHMKKHGRVVLLTATPETVYNRVKDSTERPILNDHMNVDFIAGLQEKRRALYEAAADVAVATDGKNPEEICREIVEKLTQLDRDTAAEQCK